MAKNLVLPEAEFDEFKRYCRGNGFDLSYFGAEILGSKKEIEGHQFDSPKVIKLSRRRSPFQGIPYDVAEWQREKWNGSLPRLQDEFFKLEEKIARIESFKFGSIVIDGKKHGRDVLMFPYGSVKHRKGGFWKFGSHVIKKAEIEELLKASPQVVVVGTGTSGKAKLASDAELTLKEAKIELITLPSNEAVERVNRLAQEGKRVSALVHITC